MKHLFINYRKSDTKQSACHLHADLQGRLRNDRVFLDESIRPGEPWPDQLRNELARAQVVFALIGKGWLNAKDESGRRRLSQPGDWVRCELEVTLAQVKEGKTKLYPVLVDDATMPDAKNLPQSLQALPAITAAHLRTGRDWDGDVDELVKLLSPSRNDLQRQIESEEACRAILSHRACCWTAGAAQLLCLVGALYLCARVWPDPSIVDVMIVATSVFALALIAVASLELSTHVRARIVHLRYLRDLGRH